LYVPNIIIYSTQQQQKKEKEKEEEGAVVALSFVWFPLDNTYSNSSHPIYMIRVVSYPFDNSLFIAPDIQYTHHHQHTHTRSILRTNTIIYNNQQLQKKEKEKGKEVVVVLSLAWFPSDNLLFIISIMHVIIDQHINPLLSFRRTFPIRIYIAISNSRGRREARIGNNVCTVLID